MYFSIISNFWLAYYNNITTEIRIGFFWIWEQPRKPLSCIYISDRTGYNKPWNDLSVTKQNAEFVNQRSRQVKKFSTYRIHLDLCFKI